MTIAKDNYMCGFERLEIFIRLEECTSAEGHQNANTNANDEDRRLGTLHAPESKTVSAFILYAYGLLTCIHHLVIMPPRRSGPLTSETHSNPGISGERTR